MSKETLRSGMESAAECPEKENQEKQDIFRVTKAGLLIPVQDLVEREGADIVLRQDSDGHTPVHWAALGGHTHILRYFLDKKIPMDVKANNPVGQQPIHWACVNGHIAIVEILLQAGISINTIDNKGCSPLIISAQYGRTTLAAFLMGKGARLQVVDREGDNALQWAAFKGHAELAKLLIYSGFNPLQKDSYGQTPLHLACLSGNLETVQLLCEQEGANINIQDQNGNTPMKLARGRNHRSIVTYLQDRASGKTRYLEKLNFKSLLFGPPGKTKAAFHFMLLMVCCYGYPTYFFKILPYTFYDHQLIHFLFLVNAFFMWYFLLKVHNTDPGFLPKNTDSYDQALKQVAIFDEWKRGDNPLSRLCHTCRLVRPLRAKHCRVTNRCVKQFDHYCPYIYNCVGFRNRHYFFCFLVTMLFTMISGEYMIRCYNYKYESSYFLNISGWIMLFFLATTTILISFTFYQACVNLTTNERMNQERYLYLRDGNNHFSNPFDQGLLQNLQEFFHFKPPMMLSDRNFV